MASRPDMHARDSSGKHVSLLNDDPIIPQTSRPVFHSPNYGVCDPSVMIRSYSNTSRNSISSSPRTPGLLRSDSHDSQTTNDPLSPITPTSLLEYGKRAPYTSVDSLEDASAPYAFKPHHHPVSMRPVFADSRSSSYAETQLYDDDSYMNGGVSDRGGKRYPCRLRESHGCEKTFTTSGHASRHAKIHTAEKGIHCSFLGCQKKFTRADNMKQHLDTHYKDRSGSSASQKPASSKPALKTTGGIKRRLSAGRSNGPPSRSFDHAEYTLSDPALFVHPSTGGYSHATLSLPASAANSSGFIFGMGGFHGSLASRPMAPGTDSSSRGLDVLAVVAASQSQH